MKILTGLTLFVFSTIASAAFDAHVHVHFNHPSLLKQQLGEYLSVHKGRALVISPSYMISAGLPGLPAAYKKPANRLIFNNKTAELVRANPDRLLGLCGMAWQWDDFSSVLNECMKNEEMVGMKLRFEDAGPLGEDRFSRALIFNRVHKALTEQPRLKFILIHTATEDFYTLAGELSHPENGLTPAQVYEKDVEELDHIIRLAGLHPDKKFILAHSMNSARIVRELSKKLRLLMAPNLYLEISESFHPATSETQEDFYKAWKDFGLERVLFGTDITLGEKPEPGTTIPSWYEESLGFYRRFFHTEAEWDLVYQQNGSIF